MHSWIGELISIRILPISRRQRGRKKKKCDSRIDSPIEFFQCSSRANIGGKMETKLPCYREVFFSVATLCTRRSYSILCETGKPARLGQTELQRAMEGSRVGGGWKTRKGEERRREGLENCSSVGKSPTCSSQIFTSISLRLKLNLEWHSDRSLSLSICFNRLPPLVECGVLKESRHEIDLEKQIPPCRPFLRISLTAGCTNTQSSNMPW